MGSCHFDQRLSLILELSRSHEKIYLELMSRYCLSPVWSFLYKRVPKYILPISSNSGCFRYRGCPGVGRRHWGAVAAEVIVVLGDGLVLEDLGHKGEDAVARVGVSNEADRGQGGK